MQQLKQRVKYWLLQSDTKKATFLITITPISYTKMLNRSSRNAGFSCSKISLLSNMMLLVKSFFWNMLKWKESWQVSISLERAILHVTASCLFTETTDFIIKQVRETNIASCSSCFLSSIHLSFPLSWHPLPRPCLTQDRKTKRIKE